MDLRDAECALALADSLHFGRAAARLYLDPAAFGRRIGRLEKQLGYRIFYRTSRTVTITDAGLQFLSEARRILVALEALRGQRPARTADGPLRLGVFGFGLPSVGDYLVRALRDEFELTRVETVELGYDDEYSSLLRREVDVGFVHYLGPVEGIDFLLVGEMESVALVPEHSDFADADSLSYDDLAGERWVMQNPRATLEKLAAWQLDPVEADRWKIRTPAGVVRDVAMSGRVYLHGRAATTYYPYPGVRAVPYDGPRCQLAVARRSDDRGGVSELLWELTRRLIDTGFDAIRDDTMLPIGAGIEVASGSP